MVEILDLTETAALVGASRRARVAISEGKLIVVPTDTVYGVAADAFAPDAVAALLSAKGRGRQSPPPVLVADMNMAWALADGVPEVIKKLAERFWPGPLTIVLKAMPSLDWDLGETAGTVALRIPDHEITLEVIRETGPLAVSSANITGQPAALTGQEAVQMLGDSVAVVLDAGASPGGSASTIIDATQVTDEGGVLQILRSGPITSEQLAEACPGVTIALAPKRVKPEELAADIATVDSATAAGTDTVADIENEVKEEDSK